MNIDTRHPIGKLDFDTEARLMPPTHYRYAKNGRSGTSDTDGDGAAENIRGNVLRNSSFKNDRGFVIGSCPDVRNNAVIYFMFVPTGTPLTYTSAVVFSTSPAVITIVNPSITLIVGTILQVTQGATVSIGTISNVAGNDYTLAITAGGLTVDPITSITIGNSLSQILRYYESSQTFENLTNAILMGRSLAFDPSKRIYNPRVIESSFGQLLTWTDGSVAPRLMNIDKMKQGGVYYDIAQDEQYINIAKRPPTRTLPVLYFDQPDTNVNNLKNKFYQFRYRYIYDNNEISSFSDISDVPLPSITLTKNNAILFVMNTGHHTVVKIQVAVRFGNGVSETGEENPEWYIFHTYDKAEEGWGDFSNEEGLFTGDEFMQIVARLDSDVNFYTVPQLAGHIEVTDENNIILANITEGYDNVEVDADVGFYNTMGQISVPAIGASFFNVINPFNMDDLAVGPQAGDSLNIRVTELPSTTHDLTYTLNSTDVLNFANYIAAIEALLIASTFFDVVSSLIVGDVATVTAIDSGGVYVIVNMTTTHTLTIKRGLKDLSSLNVGIEYHDLEYRSGGVNRIATLINVNSNIVVPNAGGDNYLYVVPEFKVTINSTAPLWAKHYHFVVTEGSITHFLQTYFSADSPTTFTLDTDYEYTAGDRIRWRYGSTGSVLDVEDHLIESYDPATKIVTFFDVAVNTPPKFGIVELYTPNRTQLLYFENSQSFPITEEGYHEGNIQDQTSLLPSISHFGGNSYYSATTNDDLFMIIINEPFYNIDYESNFWWKGRVTIETPNQKQLRIGTLIRWGGALINNTQINNLNVWDEGNYNNQINARNGDITGIRQIGYTLKIVQWSNINSAFLGRKQIQNADGSTQLVVTDSLIGTINPSEMEFGTRYPGSVVCTGRRLYFFDSLKAMVLVDDGNGVSDVANFPLSVDGETKVSTTMSQYWRQIAALVSSSSNYDVITGVDYLYRDVYFSIVNYNLNTQQTIYYNEPDDSWKYFMDMENTNEAGVVQKIIDWYGNVGQSFFAFMEGNIFQFNKLTDGDTPVYSTLFKINETDPLKEFVVETIAMIDDGKVKIFLSHGIRTNHAISLVEIRIPANTMDMGMYPNGMYTVLKPGNYSVKEGVFYADIKRDMFTSGIPANTAAERQAIANGRPMRGHVCLVRIHYSTDEYVRLYSTGVGMIPSELS